MRARNIVTAAIVPAALLIWVLIFAGGQQQQPLQQQPQVAEAASSSARQGLVLVKLTVADAGGADQLNVRFPVFWYEKRMDDVRMEKKADGSFEATVMLPKGSLVRYQYDRPGKTYDEREQIGWNVEANRMVHATRPLKIADSIYSWGPPAADEAAEDRPAKISGRVTDAKTGAPITDAVIAAGGVITFTAGDGSYELQTGPGKKQVIAYLLDGSYKTKSRFATGGKVDFKLDRAEPARVTITVDAGNSNLPAGNKVRIYSSAEQMGPRFLVANRFLTESFVTIDRSITLDLHEGQYVDYLYTVGNPGVSYEGAGEGRWVIRHFIAKDGLVINDRLAGSFANENSVTLNVRVPPYTDPGDIIGVSGIHPALLLMHPRGDDGEWTLTLSGERFEGRHYRYYKGFGGAGNEATTRERTITSGEMNDAVAAWNHQSGAIPQKEYDIPPIKNRFVIFAFQADYYNSNMAVAMERQLDHMAEKGFHGIVLSQIWGYKALEPYPKIVRDEPMTLYTPAFELKRITEMAHERGLKVSLYPQLTGAEARMAEQGTYDEKWWGAWLKEIEKFNMYNARTAEAAGIDYVFVGNRQPGLEMHESFKPGYNAGMEKIIDNMRTVYGGMIISRIDGSDTENLDYWESADAFSHLSWDRLELGSEPTQEEIDAAVGRLLDEKYLPLHLRSGGKPFFIDQLAYESTDGAANGLKVSESEGVHTDANHRYPLDWEEQRMIHEAYYKALNERSWIAGANLFGYGFTDTPEGREVNVRGKPAEDLAGQWARAISSNS